MILQALYEYYHRKADYKEGSIAPLGFQYKEIPFLVVLDEHGKFILLEDTREEDGKKKRAKSFLVPAEVKRTSGVAANLLWDKPDYVLGYVDDQNDPKKKLKVEKAHSAFLDKLTAFCDQEHLPQPLQALLAFLNNEPLAQLSNDPLWKEIQNSTNNFLTFKLKGQAQIICEMPEVVSLLKKHLKKNSSSSGERGQYCLITGRQDKIELTHPVIKGVLGSQTSGANIVSFNLSSFCSYGKHQGENAPVGQQAATAYTTALNLLLGKDSKQKIQLSGTTVVFWAEKGDPQGTALEDQFAIFFADDKDNPDQGKREIQALYHSPWRGKEVVKEAKNRFYVLGLSPNAARLAIRFWHVMTVDELGENIDKHFKDLSMDHGPYDSEFLPLKLLIKELCPQRDLKNAPPNLEGALFESILLGVPYPLAILQALVRRIHAEQAGEYSPVNYPRAALLKAFLNRWYRSDESIKSRKEFTMALDENNDDIGYCLGRLLYILERLQKKAHDSQKINSSIRSTYYSSLSSTPALVFSRLIRLSKHHLEKISKDEKSTNSFEKSIQEVMSHIPPEGPPKTLTLLEQGAFAVGYYHQRAFRKQNDPTEAEESEPELQTV